MQNNRNKIIQSLNEFMCLLDKQNRDKIKLLT